MMRPAATGPGTSVASAGSGGMTGGERESLTTDPHGAPETHQLGQPLAVTINFDSYSCSDLLTLWGRFPEPRNDCSAAVIDCFMRELVVLCRDYLASPRGSTLARILSLPKLGLSRILTRGHIGAVRRQLRQLSSSSAVLHLSLPAPLTADRPSVSTADQAEMFMSQGFLSRASRALFDDAAAVDVSPAVVAELQSLQRPADALPFPQQAGQVQPAAVSKSVVCSCVSSINLDTSGGPSGWPVFLLKAAMKEALFVDFLVMLVNQIVQGTAPARDLLCASRLVPLRKSNGKLRPIAVGELFYRVAGKAHLTVNRCTGDLLPRQLGVGTAGGTEPIVDLLRERVTPASRWACIQLDLTNAFNSVSRRAVACAAQDHNSSMCRFLRWAYGSSSLLVVRGGGDGGSPLLLSSEQGVRQGDPLGPYLFCLGIRPVLERLQQYLGDECELWVYMDDTFVFCRADLVDAVRSRICQFFSRGNTHSLMLNDDKTVIITPDLVASSGVEVLGTALGTIEFRRAFLRSSISALRSSILSLTALSKQSALLLLRHCLIPSLNHLLRNLDSDDLLDEWAHADECVMTELQRLLSSPALSSFSLSTLRTLPFRLGGLGLPSFALVRPHAFAAAQQSARYFRELLAPVHDPIPVISSVAAAVDVSPPLPPPPPPPPTPPPPPPPPDDPQLLSQKSRCATMWKSMHDQFMSTLPLSLREVFRDHQSQISYAWCLALPLASLPSLRLTDREVSVGLMTRTFNPGFVGSCRCGATASPSHDLVCRANSEYRTARHEELKRCMTIVYRACNCHVRSEPVSENSTSGDRADLTVRGPAAVNGINCVLDISVVSSLSSSNLPLSRLLSDRHNEKLAHYVPLFTNGEFFPFVLSCNGTLHESVHKIFAAIAAAGYSVADVKRDISVSLLRSRARAFYIH